MLGFAGEGYGKQAKHETRYCHGYPRDCFAPLRVDLFGTTDWLTLLYVPFYPEMSEMSEGGGVG